MPRQKLTSQLKTYLTGRYPNDSYAGGNPWQVNKKCIQNTLVDYSLLMQDFYNVMQLLCAVLAECFYTGASITFKAIKCLQHHLGPFHPLLFLCRSLGDFPLSREEHGRWMDLLYVTSTIAIFLISLLSPAWGGSNSTRPCSSSSVRRGRHHDQAVGACQGGMPNEQNHLKEITYTKGTKIPKNPTFSLEFHLSSSSFRMAGRLTSRLTKILECRWIFSYLSQVSKVVFSPLPKISHGVMPTSCMRSTSGSEGQC